MIAINEALSILLGAAMLPAAHLWVLHRRDKRKNDDLRRHVSRLELQKERLS
jgi:hypothetical protein